SGSLALGSNGTLGSSTLNMANGTTLRTALGSMANDIGLAGTNTADTGGIATTLWGTISGIGVTLNKTGTGTLTLGGNNSDSGTTTLTAGTLALGDSHALGTSTLHMANGTTLRSALSGLSIDNDIALTGTTTVNSHGTTTLAGDITGSGGLTKTGDGTL